MLLDGEAIHRRPTKEVAKVLGLLPQNPIAPDGVVVADLVGRGRHPHQGVFTRWTAEDRAAVEEAMVLTDTFDLADRAVDELSGGQRQRVWIAMALAQGTDLLLLDEPTTYLDVAHQVEMLDLLAELNARRGTTIVMVLHDLNLSARYADHLVALHDGPDRRRGNAGRGRHRGRRPHRLRPRQPGHRRPRLAHPARGARRAARPARPSPGEPMTVTTSTLPMLFTEVEVVSVERLSPTLRPRRARRARSWPTTASTATAGTSGSS